MIMDRYRIEIVASLKSLKLVSFNFHKKRGWENSPSPFCVNTGWF